MLVLYDPVKAGVLGAESTAPATASRGVSTATGPGASAQSGTDAGGTAELDRVAEKIRKLSAKEREKRYIGLSNQGATCYMNSAI